MRLWIFALALIAYYALHSVLAANSVKNYLYKIVPSRLYRLFFNFSSIVLLIGLIQYFKSLPTEFIIHSPIWIGIILLIIGGILLIGALTQYNLSEFAGWHQLNHAGKESEHSLNQKGLNQYVRHPLYTAMFFILIGFFFYFPTTKTLIAVSISILYLLIGTRLEEQKLVLTFGNAYINYQKKVGRFLPKLF